MGPLFFVSSCMIAHLGEKPVSGGRPPRDIIIIGNMGIIHVNLFQVWDSDRVVMFEFRLKIKSVGIVSRM